VFFEIVGELSVVETIATGSGIPELDRLRKRYGRGRWRKRKGIARVRLSDGESMLAELQDYPYPRELVVTVDLPQALRRRVLQAA